MKPTNPYLTMRAVAAVKDVLAAASSVPPDKLARFWSETGADRPSPDQIRAVATWLRALADEREE